MKVLGNIVSFQMALFVMNNFDWWINIWTYMLMNYYMNVYIDELL